MLYTGFTEGDSSSRCSTASPAGDNLTYYPSPSGSYSSLGSPINQSQDFADLSASASFIPTVTAISTAPDLQWMVQPTTMISVAPSQNRLHPYNGQDSSPTYGRVGTIKSAVAKGTSERRSRISQLSPEEEEKRKVRRERNKMAAAKCRNRRRELTDTLQAETDSLEDMKSSFQNEIDNLMKEKERLEFILAAHKPACKIPADLEMGFPETSVSPAHSLCSEPTSQATSTILAASTLGSSTVSPKPTVFSSGPVTLDKMSDLNSSLEVSLDLLESLKKTTEEASRSVPDLDFSSPFYTPDWEPLYTPSTADFELLCTPACTTYTSSFAFTYPGEESKTTCGVAHRRGSSNDQSCDSLRSPTLLAL